MKTMVCFQAGGGAFAVPVTATTGVRPPHGITNLPGSRDDVVGILPGDPPLTVLSTLGVGRDHILVLRVDDISFGLLVQRVIGVRNVEEADIGPPPAGQSEDYVAGTLRDANQLILVADPQALLGRL